MITSVAALSGTVVNYADPGVTQPLTTNWSFVSGPGTVQFEKPSSLATNAFFGATGSYVLQLSATDGTLSATSQVNILVTPPLPDIPPTVSAGANLTTTVGATLNLTGTVSEPNPQAQVSIQWSQLSGPGTGTTTFGTPTAATTTALFSQAGTYVLNLVASDGTMAANSMVTVTVNPAAGNQPPVPTAGANQTVLQNTAVTLNGSVTDDSYPGTTLTSTWQVADGPGTVTFGNAASPQTTATFSAPGIYQLRLVASDGQYTNKSFTTITVNPATVGNSALQQGANGYTGASDSYVSSATPSSNFGTTPTMLVRGSTSPEDALIQWSLPAGTAGTVTSASVTLDVTALSSSGGTGGSTGLTGKNAATTFNLYALDRAWVANQVTYVNSSSTTQWAGTGATGSSDSSSTIIGSFTISTTGFVTVNLNAAGIALVQSWINNPSTNDGIIIRGGTSATQVTLASSDNATVSARPTLTIGATQQTGTFTPPPITNVTAAANAAFFGADGQRDGYMAPVGMDLTTLYFRYLQWQQNGSQGSFTTTNPLIHLEGNSVLINVTSSFNVSALQTALQGLGMQVTGVAGPDISGFIPLSQLANLAMTSGLNFADAASSYLAAQPADATQGVVAIQANTAQTQFGVNGSGVTVGVMSDSYNNLAGAATDVANGQLPANVNVLQDDPFGDGTDEGRAMVQIVHAVAPGANLAFATADLGDASFAQNIEALQSQANANVEVDDVGFFDEPFFQEGIISQAVDSVASKGVAYFSAAGNDGSQAWQGSFTDSGTPGLEGGTLNNFGGGVTFQQVTVPIGSEVTFDFQWNQPFASAGGKGSASQMDFFLTTGQNLTNVVAEGINNTIGGDAIQLVSFFNDGSFGTQTFFVAIEHDSGPTPTVMKYIGLTDGLPFAIDTFTTQTGSTFGHAVALGAAGVGAADYTQTPPFGVSPAQLEPFSSTGFGTEFLFDTAGNALSTPLARQEPMFVGADGVNLNVTGTTEFTPFFGTSAAAPHVAGVAALMMQEAGGGSSLNPSTIYTVLENTATPMSSTPGFNPSDGFGLVNADAAVAGAKSAPKLSLPAATLSVSTNPFSENGGTTVVTATLSKAATAPVTIGLSFTGTATFGTQYTASSTVITIAVGQTFGSITITGKDDGVVTGDLTVIVGIASIQNATIAGGSQSLTIIRSEADQPEIALTVAGGFGPNANAFDESGGSLQVVATLTKPLSQAITINLGFSGDAVLNTNYSASATSITIAAGSTTGSITLTGIPNTSPNVPTASVFITILSITPPGLVKQVSGSSSAVAEAVDNLVLSNPFGQNPTVSISPAAVSIPENGGKATITISLSTVSQTTTIVPLHFSGTGANLKNYTVTDANGVALTPDSLGNTVVMIDRGQTSTTITVTGVDDFLIDGSHTLIITLGAVDGGTASSTNNTSTVTITNTDTKPSVGLILTQVNGNGLSQDVFTVGGQLRLTANLQQVATAPVTITLAFTGTATPNLDYTITEAAGQPSPGTRTDQIFIPANQSSGSVILTGLNDSLFRAETTVNVGIASAVNAVFPTSPTVTAFLVNEQVPVTFSAQNSVTAVGGVAAVNVTLSRALRFQVSVDYVIQNGTAVSGADFLLPNGSTTGTLTFAANVTEQTIFISTFSTSPSATTKAFTVTLQNPSLDVPASAAPTGIGVAIGNGTVTSPATVTILESVEDSQNFVAGTQLSTFQTPPDIAAAVGAPVPQTSGPPLDPRIVVMLNGQYTVLDAVNTLALTSTTLDTFWTTTAGQTLTGDAVDPRVIFDPQTQRFFAVAINPPGAANNSVLFAVSKTSDPLAGWTGFTLPVDPNAKLFSAVGVAIGTDANGVYISADLVNPINGATSETVFSIPKVDFKAGAAGTTNFTQFFNVPSGPELQPALNFGAPQPTEVLLSGDAGSNSLLEFGIVGAANPNAAITAANLIGTPTLITNATGAPQGGTLQTIANFPAGFSGSIFEFGNDLWAVETVLDPATGGSDIQWYDINVTNNTLTQSGRISDPNLSFYDASVAVSSSGKIVIGFTGSSASQFASSYAVVGYTTNGVTSFTSPFLLATGSASYSDLVNGVNVWGNYSSTVFDPNDPNSAWTFQEIATPTGWAVEASKITTTPPPQLSEALVAGFGGVSRGNITGGGGANAVLTGGIPITGPAILEPVSVPQSGGPNIPIPGQDGAIDSRFSSYAVEVNGNIWVVQTVQDPTTLNDDIRWYEINATTNTILQTGLIADPSLYFFYGSIAVNNAGTVVIGFSGSDASQFISSYAVMGTTTGGVTTFSAPTLLEAGTGAYNTAALRWGDYSTTTIDPSNSNSFWTFQEIAIAGNEFAVQVTQVTGPTLTIGANFQAATGPNATGFEPPDTMGGVGPSDIVVFINGQYTAFNKTTDAILQTSTLDQFWTNAGVTFSQFTFDPRILYDPSSGRWFAVSDENGGAVNHFLVAVSKTSDPTQGWTGFSIASDPTGQFWMDFPTLGLDADSVVISGNMFQISGSGAEVNILSIPKANLLAGTDINFTLFQNVSPSLGFAIQPVVNFAPAALATPTVTLSPATPSTFSENEGTATITATLSGIAQDNVLVTLNFAGTAIADGQYVASSQTIVIPAGSLSGSITLTGLPVNVDGTPTVIVSIAAATNAIVGSPSSSTAAVIENGVIPAGNISGEVYNDANFDGVLDNGETGIPNVIVFLDKDGTGTFDVANDPFIFSQATGSVGNYTIFGLAAGSYTVDQVVPGGFGQTQPSIGGYTGVIPPAGGLNFGDAPISNPGVSLSVNVPEITDDGSRGILKISLATGTALPVQVQILVGGLAPFGDYTLTGPGGPVTLTAATPTFTATIPAGQTSVSYTIAANADTTGTLETITFRIVNVTNTMIQSNSQAETSIITATGTPQLVIDSTTQISATGTTPGFSFGAPTSTFTAGNQPDFITSADLNGNGIPDLIVANSHASSITVILDPTSANPVTTTYAVGPNPTAIVAADFNGDGALDLAVTNSSGVTILLNNGFGHFTVGASYATGSAPSAIAAGDFNGDGNMDLVVANENSNTISILYGLGNGTFRAPVNMAVGSAPTDVKVADLNKDGRPDIVVANNGASSNSVTVFLNTGVSGSPANAIFSATSYLAGVQPQSIAIADFNGDGKLDIAVSNVGPNPMQSGNMNTVTILQGDGTGKFTAVPLPISGQPLPAGTFPAGPSVSQIFAADVNGDGHPDLIVANNGMTDNQITVLVNNGNGTFQAPQSIPVGANNIVESVVAGDFYGNGAIDIASANSFGTAGVNGVTIFKNADVPASLLFHVYLSHPSTSTVAVNFATQNGTGTAFTDYMPVSGTLRFAPGTTVETIAVPILPGAGNNKTVVLQLAAALNAPIQIGTGVGTINPLAPAPSLATAQVIGGNLVVNDPSQNDMIQFIQLSPGTIEVLVNGEELGTMPFPGVTGQVQLTTPNGLDTVFVDEEVQVAGTVTNPAVLTNSNDGDFVFAELVNGANWLLQT